MSQETLSIKKVSSNQQPSYLELDFRLSKSKRGSKKAVLLQKYLGKNEVPLDGISHFKVLDQHKQILTTGQLENPIVGHNLNGLLRKVPILRPNITHDLLNHFMITMLNPLTKYYYLTEFLEGSYTIAAHRIQPRKLSQLPKYSDKSQLVVGALDLIPAPLKQLVYTFAKKKMPGNLILLTSIAVETYQKEFQQNPELFKRLRNQITEKFEAKYRVYTRKAALPDFKYHIKLGPPLVMQISKINTKVLQAMRGEAKNHPEYQINLNDIPSSYMNALQISHARSISNSAEKR